jgi:hypothetical protein
MIERRLGRRLIDVTTRIAQPARHAGLTACAGVRMVAPWLIGMRLADPAGISASGQGVALLRAWWSKGHRFTQNSINFAGGQRFDNFKLLKAPLALTRAIIAAPLTASGNSAIAMPVYSPDVTQ